MGHKRRHQTAFVALSGSTPDSDAPIADRGRNIGYQLFGYDYGRAVGVPGAGDRIVVKSQPTVAIPFRHQRDVMLHL